MPPDQLRGLALSTLFRGEPRQLAQWCNFHLLAGADKLFITLDRPGDDLVAALPADPRIVWQPMSQERWSRIYPPETEHARRLIDAFKWAAQQAAEEGIRHLGFLDADELVVLSRPFADIVADHADATAMTLQVREMWHTDESDLDDPFGARLSLDSDYSDQFDWQPFVGWRAQFMDGGHYGHRTGKTIYRLPLAPGLHEVHCPTYGPIKEGRVLLDLDVAELLHYDSGSLTAWRRKWATRISGDTRSQRMRPRRMSQRRLFARVQGEPEGQVAFFRRFFGLDADMRTRLESAGRLKTFDVAPPDEGPVSVRSLPAEPMPPMPSGGEPRVDHQLALVCDGDNVDRAIATIVSVVAQMGDRGSLRFVVLCDAPGRDAVRRLHAVERTRFDVQVVVHDIAADLDRDADPDAPQRGLLGRAYLPDFLPEQRTLCLEPGLVAIDDLSPLFELELGDACLAGVVHPLARQLARDPESVPAPDRARLVEITGGNPADYVDPAVLVLDVDHPDFDELALQARATATLRGRALARGADDALNLDFTGHKLVLEGEPAGLIRATDPGYEAAVTSAEALVGVGSGLPFSLGDGVLADLADVEEWVAELRPWVGGDSDEDGKRLDVELVDITDDAVYLTISDGLLRLAAQHHLDLVALTPERELFRVPLAQVGPPQWHLAEEVGVAPRRLPVDVAAALRGQPARTVELFVADPAGPGYARHVGRVPFLVAGEGTPELLVEHGVTAEIELRGARRLKGRVDGPLDLTVTLHVGKELVARAVPEKRERTFAKFQFRVAALVKEYGEPTDPVTVRLAGTNQPLPGPHLTVRRIRRQARAARTSSSSEAPALEG